MSECTCPKPGFDIRCPIHGEPLPSPEATTVFDESGLDVPTFIREHRAKEGRSE